MRWEREHNELSEMSEWACIQWEAVRFWEEWKETQEAVKRGKTEKVVVYADISVIPEGINLILQLRKAVIEVYPELNWSERKVKERYQKIKGFGKMANDGVGDFLYNSNSSVVSDFAGGFFNVSDMEENSSVAASAGSFLNGIVCVEQLNIFSCQCAMI